MSSKTPVPAPGVPRGDSVGRRSVGCLIAAVMGAVVSLPGCGNGADDHATAQTHAVAPASGGVIAFRRYLDPAKDWGAIFTIAADGSGERQVTFPGRGEIDSEDGPPSFTPDGASMVFSRQGIDGHVSLWRANGDGSALHALPRLWPDAGRPVLSPDGTRLAVAGVFGKPDRFGNPRVGLYVLHADGTAPRRVVLFDRRAFIPRGATWSPDGARLVFTAVNNGLSRPKDASALYSVSVTGAGLHRITPWDTTGQIIGPVFAPDGRRVLFELTPRGEDFGGDYYTVRADGSDQRQLTHFGNVAHLGSASWSADGRRIVYANDGVGGQDDIFIMRADGTPITQVTHTRSWESAATWVPGR